MKHCRKGRKFGRPSGQRKALLRSLAVGLILREKIITTEAKAKGLRSFVERLVTKGKLVGSGQDKKNLAAVRYLAKYLPDKARQKLTEQSSPRYRERPGGYTRVVKLEPRRTDGAKMALIEFVK